MLARIAAQSQTPSRAVETPADFNAANRAMAAAALEETFGIKPQISVFDDYRGLLRRQEMLLCTPQCSAIADYAHHPNEVKSFLEWFGKKFDGEKIVVFQPHRYTRTRRFAGEFAQILGDFSKRARIYLLPVYAASEPFDPLGESTAIAEKSPSIKLASGAEFFRMVEDKLKRSDAGKTAIAIVGAGDFYFEAKKFFGNIK